MVMRLISGSKSPVRQQLSYMLSTNANLLLFDAISHGLGDDDAQRPVGNVEDAPSAAVVVLMWHT